MFIAAITINFSLGTLCLLLGGSAGKFFISWAGQAKAKMRTGTGEGQEQHPVTPWGLCSLNVTTQCDQWVLRMEGWWIKQTQKGEAWQAPHTLSGDSPNSQEAESACYGSHRNGNSPESLLLEDECCLEACSLNELDFQPKGKLYKWTCLGWGMVLVVVIAAASNEPEAGRPAGKTDLFLNLFLAH